MATSVDDPVVPQSMVIAVPLKNGGKERPLPEMPAASLCPHHPLQVILLDTGVSRKWYSMDIHKLTIHNGWDSVMF